MAHKSVQSETARRAGEEAARLHAEAYGTGGTGEGEGGEGTPAPAAPVETAPKDNTVDFWKHKYNTLQGMFNAEVPRLSAKIRELGDRNASLEALIAGMQTAAPVQKSRENSFSLINEDDVNDYGEDLIGLVKRAAKEELGPELAQLKQENEYLKRQSLQTQQTMVNVNAETVKNARQVVFDTLNASVPDWQMINKDPDFINWLAEPDILSGDTRQNMLNRAFESSDAPRVLAFFKKYVAERSLTGHRQDPTQVAPTVRMDTLVAPGRPHSAGSAPAQASSDDELWTNAEVNAFYADVQRGKFKNNPAEKARIEASIMRAANTGRIR